MDKMILTPFNEKYKGYYKPTESFTIAIQFYRKLLERRNLFISPIIPIVMDQSMQWTNRNVVTEIWHEIVKKVLEYANWDVGEWESNTGKCTVMKNTLLKNYLGYRKERKDVIQKFFQGNDKDIEEALAIIRIPIKDKEEGRILVDDVFQIYYMQNIFSNGNTSCITLNFVSAILVMHDTLKEAEDIFGL